jgi:uncharacterized protein
MWYNFVWSSPLRLWYYHGVCGLAFDGDTGFQWTSMANVISRDDAIISGVVERLASIYHPERIYLFGSVARGDAGPDSDLDILLVMPDDAPPELLSPARAYEALWGLKAAVEVHLWSHSRFESRLGLKASLPSVVEREGRLLYGA